MPLSLQEILAGLGQAGFQGTSIFGLDQFGRQLPAGQSPFLANRAQLVTPSGGLNIGGDILQQVLSTFLTDPSRFNLNAGITGSPESALRGVLRPPDPRVAQPGANVVPGAVKGTAQGAHGDEDPGAAINRILDDLFRTAQDQGDLRAGFNDVLKIIREHRDAFPFIKDVPGEDFELDQNLLGEFLRARAAGSSTDDQIAGFNDLLFPGGGGGGGAGNGNGDGDENGDDDFDFGDFGGLPDFLKNSLREFLRGDQVFPKFQNTAASAQQNVNILSNPLTQALMGGLQSGAALNPASNVRDALSQFLTSTALGIPSDIDAFINAQAGFPGGGPILDASSQAMLRGLAPAGSEFLLGDVIPELTERARRTDSLQALAGFLGGGAQGANVQGALNAILGPGGGLPGQRNVAGLIPGQLDVGSYQQALAGGLAQMLGQGQTPLQGDIVRGFQQLQQRGQPSIPQVGPPGISAPSTFEQLRGLANFNVPGVTAPSVAAERVNIPGPQAIPGITAPSVAAERVNIPGAAGISPVAQPGLTGEVGSQISQMLRGGGLTPEFVQAQRNLILEPSRQQLQGQFNQSVQGAATAQSGLLGELQRRQERDFNDQLIRQGFENFQNTLQAGLAQAGQEAQTGFANQQALQRQQEFGVNAALQQALANQQAQLEAQRLGGGFGLTAQQANQQALQRFGEFGTTTGIQQALANQQAQLEAQRLGGGFGLTAQQANVQAALQRPQVAGDVLGRLAGFETGIAQQSPQLALQAALANQAAQQRAGEFGGTLGLQQLGVGADIQRQIAQQMLQSGQLQAGLSQQAFGTGLGAFGAIPQAAFPFLQLAGNLPIEQTRALTPVAELLGTIPLQQARLAGDIGTQLRGLEFGGLDRALQQQQLIQQNLFSRLGLAQDFLGGQQQFGLGQAGLSQQLISALLSGEFQRELANTQLQSQLGAARAGSRGAIIGGGISAAGAVAAAAIIA